MSLASVLQTALSGMSAAGFTIEVASNNLANARTNGFKASRPVFATQSVRALRAGSAPKTASGGANPVQIGTGVNVAGVTTDFSQGPLVVDPNPSDDDSTSLVPRTVELSNTDVGQNLIDVLLASNSFRANAIVFSGADQMLTELTNLRRLNG